MADKSKSKALAGKMKSYIYNYDSGKKVSKGFKSSEEAHKELQERHKAHLASGSKMGFPLHYVK